MTQSKVADLLDPKPRRRPSLTRERVLRMAIRLADREGIDAVSMRRVGQALGVEAMSLYTHVRDKDDLLGGMADLVVGEIPLPSGPD
jgi:AcrR family transcriptional regulator